MRIGDLFEETYFALMSNKARSGLTILGIIIGVGSVIAMIAIGQGSQSTIESSIQSLGSNLITVSPGAQRNVGAGANQGRGSAQTLTLDDANAIRDELEFVKDISPELSGRYQITAKGTNTNTSVIGASPSYLNVRNVELENGDFISEQNLISLSKVAVLGPTTAIDLFGEDAEPIGQSVRINRIDFKVIGVTKTKGGSGFTNQDDMIFIPISTAQKFLAGSERVSSISIQAVDEKSMSFLQEEVANLLLVRHNISDPLMADFTVMNQTDIVSAASAVTNTFTMLLGSVAAISLLVGGIGIMNMMLTNVTERTREIGLRKSVGATRGDINIQFLTEAIILTFVGGILGVFIGWLVSFAMSQFAGVATAVSLSSVFLAFGVSALIGIVFGYYPAKKASQLSPIEALRYE